MIHATMTWCHPIAVGFLGITKCAHTSILHSLLEFGCGDPYDNQQIAEKWQTPRYGTHYWTFTFVRNPYDRLVSGWADKVANPHCVNSGMVYHRLAAQYGKAIVPGMSFPRFVQLLANTPPLTWDRHFQQQSRFLSGCKLDFTGRVESMASDWPVIESRAGREMPLGKPRRASRRNRDYRAYYNADTRALVRRMYAEDLGRFGYNF